MHSSFHFTKTEVSARANTQTYSQGGITTARELVLQAQQRWSSGCARGARRTLEDINTEAVLPKEEGEVWREQESCSPRVQRAEQGWRPRCEPCRCLYKSGVGL